MSEENEVSEEQVDQESEIEAPDYSQKLGYLEDQIGELRETNSQLLDYLKALQQPQEKKKQEFDYQQMQQFSQDPNKLAEFIENTAEKKSKAVEQKFEKKNWDAKAYSDFEILGTDKKFQSEVKKQMSELINDGDYTVDSPKLLYRAAQLAATRYAASNKGESSQVRHETSVAPSNTATLTTKRSKIDDSDPRVRFFKMIRPKATKEQVEAFKKDLSPTYERETIRKRSLM